jgi:acyl carrier protein
MSTDTTASAQVDEDTALADVSGILRVLLDEYGLDDADITMATKFHNDLELESIDLVALSGSLRDHYGDKVNFAAFIAERGLEEIIELTVGDLVTYIVSSLRSTEKSCD